jgi:hypothetical protein
MHKEAGNKAFKSGDFAMSVQEYTRALTCLEEEEVHVTGRDDFKVV